MQLEHELASLESKKYQERRVNLPATGRLVDPKNTVVLVVEDNVANFVLIARILGYIGYHCEWKASAFDLAQYSDTLPRLDLILMDIRLPHEDGYVALQKIRNSQHHCKVPIIAITAETNQEQMNQARRAGFDGFIGKPLDPDRFPEQIRRILKGEPVWELYS
jgi:two-component system cell cycle response regulator DivK